MIVKGGGEAVGQAGACDRKGRREARRVAAGRGKGKARPEVELKLGVVRGGGEAVDRALTRIANIFRNVLLKQSLHNVSLPCVVQ